MSDICASLYLQCRQRTFILYKVNYLIFLILERDVVVKRQEALAAARLKMQEELNAQVEKHKEKLRQVCTGFTLNV